PNHINVGCVVAQRANHRQQGPGDQSAAREINVLGVDVIRKTRKTRNKKIFQTKKLKFFRGFAASPQHSQVVKLSTDRSLPKISRIPKECEMAFAEKCRQNPGD